MNKRKTLLAAATAAAVSLGAFAADKYALVVGVDKYAKTYAGVSSLSGCVTDVNNVSDMLVNCGGWSTEAVRKLTNEKATVADVRATLKELAGCVRSGDTFFLYWSSHGAYTYDPGTGKEESFLCAHDRDYKDTMLAEDLGRFPSGAKVVVMIDTCHSGALFQTATVGGNAKAAAPTFAQRVDALLSRSKAGGIAAGEVGWLTAVAYDQESVDLGASIGGRYTGNCLVYDGVYWGKADTDGDGDISFLDLHTHARKWFSLEAAVERHEAIYGKSSNETQNEIKTSVLQCSPQALHADVLASVLVRDHVAAGGNRYPLKVEFHLVCDNQEVNTDYAHFKENSSCTVQFVWPGDSAEEPAKYINPDYYEFMGWDRGFDNVQKDLIVRGECVNVREPDVETLTTVAERVKKFVGIAMAGCRDSESNDCQYVVATFEGAYAKGGKLVVTLTDVDGTKTKFTGRLDMGPANGRYGAVLTSAKYDDTIEIWLDASSVRGTYRHGDGEYPVQGNWDWLSTSDTAAQAVCRRFAAVYNVGMDVDFFFGERETLPKVGGYVNVVLSEQNGKAKVTGVLGDGTKISVTTKAVVLSTLAESLNDKGVIYVPIVFARTNKRSGFSGLLALNLDSSGARFANFDYNKGGTRAYWDNPAQGEATAYQAFLKGEGSEFIANKMPETASTDMPYTAGVPPLYVKMGGRLVELACETNALPGSHSLAYANGKFKVTDPQPDDAKLKLMLNKRTGVISGSFRVWYADDPEYPSVEKYVTANVYGGWESHHKGAWAFGLVTDTHPDRAKLKLKVPVELTIKAAAASVAAGEN